ncbi:MAG: Gldg family protein [Treponema sp.]|nr:Gldg family protein [Treponema sp.]
MKSIKNFIKWIKSPASDFVLFVIVLVLANLVSNKAFLRIDLTNQKTYSLSEVSKQVIKTIEEPLSIKFFYTPKLPAPYNNVEQYVKDLLVEYKGNSKGNFSYECYKMDNTANQNIARDYNLQQFQIQEIKNDAVGFKQVWLGLAIIYADHIDTIDQITSTDGLEYKLTTKISKMISTTNALAGLDNKVKMTLYYSKSIEAFNIDTAKLESLVKDAYTKANEQSMDRIDYSTVVASDTDIDEISGKYGIGLKWNDRKGNSYKGVIGITLEYNDKFRVLPIEIQPSLFGYSVTGLDDLETSLKDTLQALVSKVQEIGYITGHGEAELSEQEGAYMFNNLLSDTYNLKELDLTKENISSGINTIVINGPREKFSDEELYKIDQFLMKGGNIALFLDSFNISQTYNQFGQPSYNYEPLDSGLDKILEKYGIKLGKDYVLDKNCLISNQNGRQELNYIPLLSRDNMNQKHIISKNLSRVIFLQSSSMDITDAKKNSDITTTVLAKSSPRSWTITEPQRLVANAVEPAKDKENEQNLAVILEGKFNSAFDSAVKALDSNNDSMPIDSHLSKSLQKGKLFIVSTASVTSPNLIDEEASMPIAGFIRNAIDYLSGNEELCPMRTKGYSQFSSLNTENKSAIILAKFFNQYLLVFIVALIGLIVLRARNLHRKHIREIFDPNDTREGDK